MYYFACTVLACQVQSSTRTVTAARDKINALVLFICALISMISFCYVSNNLNHGGDRLTIIKITLLSVQHQ